MTDGNGDNDNGGIMRRRDGKRPRQSSRAVFLLGFHDGHKHAPLMPIIIIIRTTTSARARRPLSANHGPPPFTPDASDMRGLSIRIISSGIK